MMLPNQSAGVRRTALATSPVVGVRAAWIKKIDPIAAVRYTACVGGMLKGGSNLSQASGYCGCVIYDGKADDWCWCKEVEGKDDATCHAVTSGPSAFPFPVSTEPRVVLDF